MNTSIRRPAKAKRCLFRSAFRLAAWVSARHGSSSEFTKTIWSGLPLTARLPGQDLSHAIISETTLPRRALAFAVGQVRCLAHIEASLPWVNSPSARRIGRISEYIRILFDRLTTHKRAADDRLSFVHAAPTLPFTLIGIVTNSVFDLVLTPLAFAWIGNLRSYRLGENEGHKSSKKQSYVEAIDRHCLLLSTTTGPRAMAALNISGHCCLKILHRIIDRHAMFRKTTAYTLVARGDPVTCILYKGDVDSVARHHR